MTDDQLEERMRQAISAGPLEPGATVWERIATRPLRKHFPARRFVLAGTAMAAGIAILLVVLRETPRTETQSTPRRIVRSEGTEQSFFSPEALMAQSHHPVFPVVRDDPIGLRLRAGTWSYTVQRDGDSVGTYFYSAEHTDLGGTPAWLLIDGRAGPPTLTRRGTDSLWTTADSMRPLQRISMMSNGRREQTFRDNDVLIGTTLNGYTTWETVPLRDSTRKRTGAIIRWNEIAVFFQTAPLGPDWKGSIPLSGSGEFGRITPVWYNFQVDGSDVLTVPGGTFDSWRIRMGMTSAIDSLIKGERPGMTLWVSKERQWLVQKSIVIAGKQTWKHVLTHGKED